MNRWNKNKKVVKIKLEEYRSVLLHNETAVFYSAQYIFIPGLETYAKDNNRIMF